MRERRIRIARYLLLALTLAQRVRRGLRLDDGRIKHRAAPQDQPGRVELPVELQNSFSSTPASISRLRKRHSVVWSGTISSRPSPQKRRNDSRS